LEKLDQSVPDLNGIPFSPPFLWMNFRGLRLQPDQRFPGRLIADPFEVRCPEVQPY